jgi:serine/threonine-protein kinase HipA
MTIKVWTSGAEAGLLGRRGERGSTFVYAGKVSDDLAVSLTMPVRLESWDTDFGMTPIFEMNMPEGALRERLRLSFAKATGRFDDFDLLTITGRSQIGRLRYSGVDDVLDEGVPFQSVDEILKSRRDGDLFPCLLRTFAAFSGISGVQPKFMLRDDRDAAAARGVERSSIRGATHIVKFWEADYPELAANEYFCLRAAERCGLAVPRFRLADDGRALVIDRFDLKPDGGYRGFEDFCVLNARRTDEKYRGSYETSVLRRFQQFASPDAQARDLERLFTLIVLNCVIRNGDAHLKNFGVTYDHPEGKVSLAPVYDLVTTAAYLPVDTMALTLEGSTRWPDGSRLRRLGETRGVGGPTAVRHLIERVVQAVEDTRQEVRSYMHGRPSFAAVGDRMLLCWSEGAAQARAA